MSVISRFALAGALCAALGAQAFAAPVGDDPGTTKGRFFHAGKCVVTLGFSGGCDKDEAESKRVAEERKAAAQAQRDHAFGGMEETALCAARIFRRGSGEGLSGHGGAGCPCQCNPADGHPGFSPRRSPAAAPTVLSLFEPGPWHTKASCARNACVSWRAYTAHSNERPTAFFQLL